MYEYTTTLVAPRLVDFSVHTHRGRRVVRILLDDPDNPRIHVFHENYQSRTPASASLQELLTLIKKAKDQIK